MTVHNGVRTLFPVVLVPVDGAGWNGDWVTALDIAVDDALNWWQNRLAFRPFDAVPALAIGGVHCREAYTPNTQEVVRAELAAYYPELAGEVDTGVVYVVYAALGADPYSCAGNVIGTSAATDNGPAVLIVQSSGSLDAFARGQNPLDALSGSRDAQTGALAHELGHALGLPHPPAVPGRDTTVMWAWWTFPACGLLPDEVTTAAIVAHGWQPHAVT